MANSDSSDDGDGNDRAIRAYILLSCLFSGSCFFFFINFNLYLERRKDKDL